MHVNACWFLIACHVNLKSHYDVFSPVCLRSGGCTALFIAAAEGYLPILQRLLDKGAAIEAKTNVSQTTLMDKIDIHTCTHHIWADA